MTKNKSVEKAIESIDNNDAVSLRKNIKEALVDKVRKALEKKEKDIAKNFLNNITKDS